MNRTRIEWTDYSWNPITGCMHGCWYCYAKKLFTRFHKSFDPTFYPERLWEPAKLKKPAKIFVCSVSDLFAPWTKEEWREAVLRAMRGCPTKHTFQLLTKQPQLIEKGSNFGSNVWVGATISNEKEIGNLRSLVDNYEGNKFISFEPLLGPISEGSLEDYDKIGWVIIGKLTGSKKVQLQKEWVNSLVRETRARNIPLFLKDNLNWHEKIQEFPKD